MTTKTEQEKEKSDIVVELVNIKKLLKKIEKYVGIIMGLMVGAFVGLLISLWLLF